MNPPATGLPHPGNAAFSTRPLPPLRLGIHLLTVASLLAGSSLGRAADAPGRRSPPPQWPRPALEVFVATDGSDANPGTRRQPFATLEQARDALRARRARPSWPGGGAVVWIRGGEYAVRQPFTLSAADGGTPDAPVVYRAWRKERPRFTGATPLQVFAPVTDPKVRARLPAAARDTVREVDLAAHGIQSAAPFELGGFSSGRGFRTHPFRELYVNGQAQPLARGPASEEVRIQEVSEQDGHAIHGLQGSKTGRFKYVGDRPGRWIGEPELWLYGYWFWDWADSYERVTSIDLARREITLTPPFHTYGYRAGQTFYAVNALSELDQPGEWCLDSKRARLYFWPPGDLTRARVQLATTDSRFLELRDAAHVAFENLTWEYGCRDAVRVEGGREVLFAGCMVRHFAGNGIELEGGTGHTLRSCDLYSLGRGGVTLAGGDRKTLTPGRHRVENCHIYDLSRIDHTYTPAVLCAGVGHQIVHNHFHDVLSSALRLGGNDHVVERNEISRAVLESDDQGGVDMWGDATYRGNVYRHNYFHHLGSTFGSGQAPKLGQAGIRLDDAISGTLVEGNVFEQCGGGGLGFGAVQIHGGKENQIVNNVFVDCPAAVSFSPWGDRRWREFVQQALESPQIDRQLYLQRYPSLARLAENHDTNTVQRNFALRCAEFLRRAPAQIQHSANQSVTNAPGWPATSGSSLKGVENRRTMESVGLEPIPFGSIGLYRDRYRTSLRPSFTSADRSAR